MANQQDSGPNALAEELRQILTSSVEGNLQLLTRVSNLARDATQSLGQNAGRAPQQPGELVNRIVRLNLSYLSLLTKHGMAFADELTTVTERALGLKSGAMPPKQPAEDSMPGGLRPVELTLVGRVGETVKAPFLIENTQSNALKIGFEASSILNSQNQPLRRAKVQFEPESLELKSGQQSTVTALIPITSEFQPGESYSLRIRVAGFNQKEIFVLLTIAPPTEQPVSPVKVTAVPGIKSKKGAKRKK